MVEINVNSVLGFEITDILEKRWNLWVGVSNTLWFQKPGRLERLIVWALTHTRQELLICIPGRMYAVNANHIEGMGRARALREGFAIEDRYRQRIEVLLEGLASKQHPPIHIVGYDDVLTTSFIRCRTVLYCTFCEEGDFYARVMEITKDFLISRQHTASKARTEAVALYQLQELPMFIAPLQWVKADTMYDAVVYPGLGKFDQLARDLIEGHTFPDLTAKLQLTEPCGIVDITLQEAP